MTSHAVQPVVFTINQASAYLSVSPDTMRRIVRSGAIPHARVGNSIRLQRKDVDEYLAARTSTEWQPVDGRGRRTAARCERFPEKSREVLEEELQAATRPRPRSN